MRFSFTDEQEMFRDTVRAVFATEISRTAAPAARSDAQDQMGGVWSSLAEIGVLSMMAPERLGGLGMNEIDLVLVVEELGYGGVPGTVGEHAGVALPALVEGGADDLAAAAATGAITCTVGLGAGGRYVVGAQTADVMVIERQGRLWAVSAENATITPQPSVDQGRLLSVVEFDIREVTLLGDADPERATDRSVLWAAAQCVGVARRLLDATVEYVTQRHQFGKPVGSYQAVKHHLADVRIAIEFAAPLIYRAAWVVANPDLATATERRIAVSMAKAMASDAVDKSCRAALQCHGAIGYTMEYDLQIWLKRGWALSSAWGDAHHHRHRVAEALGV